MSTDIGGRAVLRPAGNVARSNLRKVSKPPPSPVKPPLNPLSSKISPPNSLPSTPKPLARTPPSKLSSPHRPPTPSPVSLHHHHQEPPPLIPLDLAGDGPKPALTAATVSLPIVEASDLDRNGSNPSGCEDEVSGPSLPLLGPHDAVSSGSEPSQSGSSSISSGMKPASHGSKSSFKVTKPSLSGSNSKLPQNGLNGSVSRTQKRINPHIVLTKSTSEVFQRNSSSNCNVKAKPSGKKNLSKLGSISFDESSLATMVAAKKAAAKEISAQRKLKVSEYGRKQGKLSRVVPEISLSLSLPSLERQRCKFITAQSDPVFLDYHDKEWGVPVHDDRMMFELLALAGFQVELSWTTILHKRDAYRAVFAEFDPDAVALFSEKHINSLEADKSLGLPGGKVKGVVNNAQKIHEVVHEFGSLDEYLWGFVNKQPMVNNYRYPKQVPVKTSKAEFISKDLVKRGFRFVGPTIIYSFMQAAGMTNDHLVQCFRHQECTRLACSSGVLPEEMLEGTMQHEDVASQLHRLNFTMEEGNAREQGPECEEESHSHQQEECLNVVELEEESHESNIAA
ncbi:hypothetical protein GOP47_0014672 [Adiantum capillus-veneris]|uniref:DNA-3-methyladenine glycosylase I n=1 Tax=Adiantum capillus-veneris TaxID=13818 RepID=A0A9D4ZCP1_ADICA|nr:hypothetical protein GOP47_0014672 [Adiantum capillus-veneris]